MTTLFCSKKLERFLGNVEHYLEPDYGNKYGNWNGHLFSINRKRFILFTNDKTAYSFVWADVRKAMMADFQYLFTETLISQLDFDLRINERQEIDIRNALAELRLTKTNNNKNILGTMNEFIAIVKYQVEYQGGLENISCTSFASGLNNGIVGTKLPISAAKYSCPKDLMLTLLLEKIN
jgi:hypothetical protein